jgi:hypothetical protein
MIMIIIIPTKSKKLKEKWLYYPAILLHSSAQVLLFMLSTIEEENL